ncbi:MAG: universal stress protein, partial [Haloarculaceae archaeon]
MDTVLLATDGSEYARRAAERAIEVASDDSASLHALCVVDSRVHGEPGLSSAELSTITAEDIGHDCVAEVRSMVEERGVQVDVDGDVKHGVPEDVILEYARDLRADC